MRKIVQYHHEQLLGELADLLVAEQDESESVAPLPVGETSQKLSENTRVISTELEAA